MTKSKTHPTDQENPTLTPAQIGIAKAAQILDTEEGKEEKAIDLLEKALGVVDKDEEWYSFLEINIFLAEILYVLDRGEEAHPFLLEVMEAPFDNRIDEWPYDLINPIFVHASELIREFGIEVDGEMDYKIIHPQDESPTS